MDTTTPCPLCAKTIDLTDPYCRYCGKPQRGTVPFRYTQGGIIVLTLLFGPIALPFIFKSPQLSRNLRTIYIILNLAISAVMIGAIFGAYSIANRQMQETLKVLEQIGINGK